MNLVKGKKTLGEKLRFQKMSMGILGAKKNAINPKIMDLSSQPLSITKNEFPSWRTIRKMHKIMTKTHQLLQLCEEEKDVSE